MTVIEHVVRCIQEITCKYKHCVIVTYNVLRAIKTVLSLPRCSPYIWCGNQSDAVANTIEFESVAAFNGIKGGNYMLTSLRTLLTARVKATYLNPEDKCQACSEIRAALCVEFTKELNS